MYFAQHYPNKNRIVFVISDFGVGIPKTIARVQSFDADEDAILHASRYGVSSKSVKNNMGVGLDTLIRYVVCNNEGILNIYSGFGGLRCTLDRGADIRRKMPLSGYYPGTFVEILMRTDTIENCTEDEENLDF